MQNVAFIQVPRGFHKGLEYVDWLINHPRATMVRDGGTIGYGMLHLATYISNKYETAIFSLTSALIENNFRQILNDILLNYDVYCLQLNWMLESKSTLRFAKLLKATYPDKPVIVGGTNASIFADQIVHYPEIDVVIRGEAEIPLEKLLLAIDNGSSLYDIKIPGVVTKYHDGGLPELIDDVNKIPIYDPGLLKTRMASSIPIAVNRVRGRCPFNCTYCLGCKLDRFHGRSEFKLMDTDWVIDQIRLLKEHGANHIYFQDEAWAASNAEEHLLEIAQKINKSGLGNQFELIRDNAAPIFSRDLLQEMVKANYSFVDFGCETGSPKLLKAHKRPYTVEQMLKSIRDAYECGIVADTWWMSGFPMETEEDIAVTEEVIRKTVEAGGKPRWVTPTVIFPYTDCYENQDDFEIQVLLSSFEDYAVYSDFNADEILSGNLKTYISHYGKNLSKDQIENNTDRLRNQIKELLPLAEKKMESIRGLITTNYPSLSLSNVYNFEKVSMLMETSFF